MNLLRNIKSDWEISSKFFGPLRFKYVFQKVLLVCVAIYCIVTLLSFFELYYQGLCNSRISFELHLLTKYIEKYSHHKIKLFTYQLIKYCLLHQFKTSPNFRWFLNPPLCPPPPLRNSDVLNEWFFSGPIKVDLELLVWNSIFLGFQIQVFNFQFLTRYFIFHWSIHLLKPNT